MLFYALQLVGESIVYSIQRFLLFLILLIFIHSTRLDSLLSSWKSFLMLDFTFWNCFLVLPNFQVSVRLIWRRGTFTVIFCT